MKLVRNLVFSVVASIFVVHQVHTQGVIQGTVRDSTDNQSLIGAHVMLQGSAFGAATDREGRFHITGIPAGPYTVRVSYVGYRTKLIPVTVRAGQTEVLALSLIVDAIEGETVVVTAQALGQAAAINKQLSSTTITNVVSSEKILDLPDANAAESVGRLPGVSILRNGGEGNKVVIRGLSPTYNAITIAGDRIPATDLDDRSVDLSMIAPEILAGIEVTKALTPDKDADALGGSVDFQLATAPLGEFRFDARAQYGYNHERDDYGNFRARLIFSDRFLDQRFGLLMTGNAEQTQRGSDRLSAVYSIPREKRPDEQFAPITTSSVTLDYRTDVRERYGFNVMLDYVIPGGKLISNNLFSRLNRDEVIWTKRYDMSGSNKMKYYLRDRQQQIDILTNSLGGEHDLSFMNVNWRLSRNVSSTRYLFNSRFQFEEASAFNIVAIPPIASPDDLINNAYNRVDQTYLYDGEVEPEEAFERDLAFQTNLQAPFTISSDLVVKLKAGAKFREKVRERNRDFASSRLDKTDPNYPEHHSRYGTPGFEYTRMPGTGYPYMSNYLDPGFSAGTFLDGKYDFGVGADRRELRYFLDHYLLDEQYRFSLQRDMDDYEVTDMLSAGYVMAELNFGDFLMVMPGVRYESTRIDATGRVGIVNSPEDEAMIDDERVQDSTSVIHYSEWFPMVHVRIRPTEWFDLRLAYTKSVSYPRLDYVLPSRKLRASDITLEMGNPGMRPQLSSNLDAYLSFYGNRIGLLTVGGFYKKIDDLIYLRSGHVILDPAKEGVEPNLRGYSITRPTNNPYETTVRGLECEWQTNFKWLPAPFDGLVLNLNYAHIWSRTDFPRSYVQQVRIPVFPFLLTSVVDTFRTGNMPDQAADIGNISVGYDVGGFSGRISALIQGKTLTFVGVREELDGFTDTYVRWDLSLKYDFSRTLGVYANVNNLTDQPDQSYMQTARYATGREYYGWTTDIGVTVKF
jgi:TonB-dependent receptor